MRIKQYRNRLKVLPTVWACCMGLSLLLFSFTAQAAKKQPVPKWLIGHSSKKGIALGGGVGGRSWLKTIELLHARWVYTWSCHPKAVLPPHLHFIPMVWGHPWSIKNDIAWLKRHNRKRTFRYLLTFNEPDNNSQSNMPVSTALKLWPQLQSTGMVLGSPACVHPDDAWMMQFMRGAAQQHDRVNFVCVHWYGPPSVAEFLQVLQRTYELYHRPIWITEFAPADWNAGPGRPNRYSEQVVARFLRVVMPLLNRLRFVQCYAWYPYGGTSRFTPLGCSGLFDKKGNLTLVGRIYAAG